MPWSSRAGAIRHAELGAVFRPARRTALATAVRLCQGACFRDGAAMSDARSSARKFDVGGQAVIEGVMMRGPRGYVTAVRRPSTGEIEIHEVPYRPLAKRWKPAGWAFLRGGIALFEMMVIGLRSLNLSAGIVAEDEAQAARAKRAAAGEAVDAEAPKRGPMRSLAVLGVLALSLCAAIGLFIVLPNLITHGLGNWGEIHALAREEGWWSALAALARGRGLGFQENESPVAYNLIAGAVRVGIFVLYVWAISLMRDIRRVFQYHGAEHKAIKAYEAGLPLTVANARGFSTEHPRCGTTFVFVTMLVAVFVFSLLTKAMLWLWPWLAHQPWWTLKSVLIASHILFLPLVAGIGYEVIKKAGKCPRHPLIRPIIWPGLLFQRITTKEPEDAMLEVALVSLERALALAETPATEGAPALDEATGAIY